MNAVTVQVGLFGWSGATVFALAPWDDVEAKWELVFKVFLFLLVTAALLTGRERIHALIWVMVISLAFFGIKGGGFTLIAGGAHRRVFGPEGTMIGDNNDLGVALKVVQDRRRDAFAQRHRSAMDCFCHDGADVVRGRRQLFARRLAGIGCGVGPFLAEELQKLITGCCFGSRW